MRRHFATMVTVVVVGSLLQSRAAAQEPPAFSRVRPTDPQARALLLDAWRSSPSVRELVQALEASDLIVQIELQPVLATYRARLRFMSAVEGCRYLRVSVKVPGLRENLLPALAHELQHAVEIANALEVRDEQAVEALLRRIGWEWKHTVFETEAALAVEERVRLEVTSVSRRRP